MIPFNKPHFTGREVGYIEEAVRAGHTSGNGRFTAMCQDFFSGPYGLGECLLTTSCTDALEMCALLMEFKPGDEVIMPSYTFVSTALAFVREGAKIVFVDSLPGHPCMDCGQVEGLITGRTRAIVAVHYAGIACDMKKLRDLADRHGLVLIEDAAQAVQSFFGEEPLGSIGHLATFSFHETKNIHCGEGGMLVINDRRYRQRAGVLWEKGTNRAQFFRGEVAKYTWVDTGSSFLLSDLLAACLWAQVESLEEIQKGRLGVWNHYEEKLRPCAEAFGIQLPEIPSYATNNAHMYYLVCPTLDERTALLAHLKGQGIHAVFHYQSLHQSQFYAPLHDRRSLPEADRYSECLLRLPLHLSLTGEQIEAICSTIIRFFESRPNRAQT